MEKHGAAIKQFVLDSSLAVAWCLDDEKTSETESVLNLFSGGAEALVPHLWAWDVNNVLVIVERAKRLTAAQRLERVAVLRSLSIVLDTAAHELSWSATAELAREHKLTTYDAAYLEMALRLNVPLGSLDVALRTAAKKRGIPLLPATV